jgi:hypothetical protein
MPGISQLSPDEETTLRSIVLGVLKPGTMRASDVERLTSLSLIEQRSGRLAPTDFGMEKYRSQAKIGAIVREPARPAKPRARQRGGYRAMPFFGLR